MSGAKDVPASAAGSATAPVDAAPTSADAARVVADLAELAAISDAGPGVTRMAYTPRDGEGRRWFARRCEQLGLRFEVDRYGNCFGWSPGADERPAVLLGSHLDSVPEGGRYDGVLGVVVGFEIARSALARDPSAPVAVVSFACEESARFGIGVIGSRLLCGGLDEAALDEIRDLEGAVLRDVLAGAGLDAASASSFEAARVAVFLEVHVDQGCSLGDAPTVGIVPAIAGCLRTQITWHGEPSHSGAHTRARRRNALLGAARFVVAAEQLWSAMEERGEQATITIGWIDNHPNAPSSVSGRTDVVVDLRAPDAGVLAAAREALERTAREVGAAAALDVEIAPLGLIEPVAMAPHVVGTLQRVAGELDIEHRLLASMAGHDSEVIAHQVPTAMLFVANPAGVSHSPDEAIDERSLAGTLALLEAAIPDLLAGDPGAHPTTPGGPR